MKRLLLPAALHTHFGNKATPAQQRAGNYRKLKMKFQGLPISVENPRGTLRQGVDPGGNAWATGMQHHYGYIRGTMGMDGDHVDCFVGPNPTAAHAYVITTKKPPAFDDDDEQKVMLGFPTPEAATAAFQQHFDDPRFLGDVVEMPMAQFKTKVMATRANPQMIKGMALLFVRRR